MSKNRDAGPTPRNTSLVPCSEVRRSEPDGNSDTSSILNGEGTSSLNEGTNSSDKKRIISSNIRVPVLSIDAEPLMPSKASRAKRWIASGKAIPIRNKIGLFAVVLTVEPSGHAKQPIALGLDPGSSFTGVAVCSKTGIHYGANLELPGKKVHERMEERSMLRRNRRYRKCRRRQCRFLNRTHFKIAPSILARKQLELRIAKELAKAYPISVIAEEDIRFDHVNKRYGKYFSQVEIGKNWLIEQLGEIAPVKLFEGWDTSIKRKEVGLAKSSNKDSRVPEAHVNDAISLCVLALAVNIPLNSNYHFDIIQRPHYSRRKLHLENPAKGGIRRAYGGTTTPFVYRKGDYVECEKNNIIYRGWVSGNLKNALSISDFDWKRLGRFSPKKTRLLARSAGIAMSVLAWPPFPSQLSQGVPWRQ